MKLIRIIGVLLVVLFVFSVVFSSYSQPNLRKREMRQPKIEIPEGAVRDDMRFGISGGMYPEIKGNKGEMKMKRITQELDKLGLIWLRHAGPGNCWFEVQPDRNTWDFSKFDAVFNDNSHPWLLFMYGNLGTVYPFSGKFTREAMKAKGNKKDIMQYVKDNTVDFNDPVQKKDAEVYVKKFVNRYKDKVKYWEIGQEGITAKEKLEVIKNTYTWIKEADPNAVVLITAIAGDDDRMYDRGFNAFNTLLSQGIGNYFDIGNIHYYEKVGPRLMDEQERRYDEYKNAMAKYGINKPIWVTETSTSSVSNSVLSGNGSEKIQAQDVVKRLVVFSAKGAQKVFWFNFRQTSPKDKFYGCNIINPNGNTKKPAYYTFKLLVEKIGYYTKVETLRRDNIRLYKFTNPDNSVVFVAWSNNLSTLDLSKYTGKDNVSVTPIVEDVGVHPEAKRIDSNNIKLSQSPVFIE